MKTTLALIFTFIGVTASANEDCTLRITGHGMCHNRLTEHDKRRIENILKEKGYVITEDQSAVYTFAAKTSVDCGKDVGPQTLRQKIEFYLVHDQNYWIELKGPNTNIYINDDNNLTSYGYFSSDRKAKRAAMRAVRSLPRCNKGAHKFTSV